MRRLFRFSVLLFTVLACGEPTAVALEGPAFFRASLNRHTWRPADTTMIEAVLAGDTLLSVFASQGTPMASTAVMGFGSIRVKAGRTTKLSQKFLNADAGFIGPLNAQTPPLAYLTDSVHTGWLRVDAIDRASQTVSGSFAFDAVSAETTFAYVRDGSFRVRYVVPPADPVPAVRLKPTPH